MKKFSFILAGVFLAALILGVILLIGILSPKYDPFGANHHTTCGQPATLRAEGYNILGGTRYGRGPDDPGDDFPLANLDFCDPFVEITAEGEERLWFWFEVDVIGQVFPYAAWGLPWEDLGRINPADDRNPIDPIWSPESVWGLSSASTDSAYWAGRQAHVCDDWDRSGLVQFFNTRYGYTIPYGTTRAGWVCLTFDGDAQPIPLPEKIVVTSRPQRARLTRWVDAEFRVRTEPGFEAPFALDTVESHAELCTYAEASRPGSLIPGGPCETDS
jgi:hypothetical protein